MSGIIPMSHIMKIAQSLYFSGIMRVVIPMRDIIGNKKEPTKTPIHCTQKDLSLSVSRVLSCTVIYLGLPSPTSSSDIHGALSGGQPYWQAPNLATGGVYMAYLVTKISVSSYLAFPSLPQMGDLNHQGKKPSRLRRFISVALSLKSPLPDVIRHPVLCCSDFPHRH